MRLIALVLLVHLLGAVDLPLIQAIKPADLDGQWTLSSDWMGMMGFGLFIAGDDYEVSFYSDALVNDRPYPHVGHGKVVISATGDSLRLNDNDIYYSLWYAVRYRGKTYLVDKVNYDTMVATATVDESRFLTRIDKRKVLSANQMVMNTPAAAVERTGE